MRVAGVRSRPAHGVERAGAARGEWGARATPAEPLFAPRMAAPPIADVRLTTAVRGETYEPSDVSIGGRAGAVGRACGGRRPTFATPRIHLRSSTRSPPRRRRGEQPSRACERWGEGVGCRAGGRPAPRPQPPPLFLCSAFELGFGSGYVAASLSRLLGAAVGPGGAQVLAADVSRTAARDARSTLAAHSALASVDLALASHAAAFLPRLRGGVDVVAFNPPYVPTPDGEVRAGGVAAAWAGGDRGRRVLDAALPMLVDLLAPGGEMFVVTVHENGPDDVLALMAALGAPGARVLERTADEERLTILRGVKERWR